MFCLQTRRRHKSYTRRLCPWTLPRERQACMNPFLALPDWTPLHGKVLVPQPPGSDKLLASQILQLHLLSTTYCRSFLLINGWERLHVNRRLVLAGHSLKSLFYPNNSFIHSTKKQNSKKISKLRVIRDFVSEGFRKNETGVRVRLGA